MYKREGKCLLPSPPQAIAIVLPKNRGAPGLPCHISCAKFVWKAKAQCSASLFIWANPSQEEIPEELEQKNLLLLTIHLYTM